MQSTKLIVLLALLLGGVAQVAHAQTCTNVPAQLDYIIRDKAGAILDPAEVTLPAGMKDRTIKEIELPAELAKTEAAKKIKLLSINFTVCHPMDYSYRLTVEHKGEQMRLVFGQAQGKRGPYLVDSLPFQAGAFFINLRESKAFTSAEKWEKLETKPGDKGRQD